MYDETYVTMLYPEVLVSKTIVCASHFKINSIVSDKPRRFVGSKSRRQPSTPRPLPMYCHDEAIFDSNFHHKLDHFLALDLRSLE